MGARIPDCIANGTTKTIPLRVPIASAFLCGLCGSNRFYRSDLLFDMRVRFPKDDNETLPSQR